MVKSLLSDDFLLQLDDLIHEVRRYGRFSALIPFHDFWDMVSDCTTLIYDDEAMSFFVKEMWSGQTLFVRTVDLRNSLMELRKHIGLRLFRDFIEDGEECDV